MKSTAPVLRRLAISAIVGSIFLAGRGSTNQPDQSASSTRFILEMKCALVQTHSSGGIL
jgi:hypothetical protein